MTKQKMGIVKDGRSAELDTATWEWSGDDPLLVEMAKGASAGYEYSVGDGVPGFYLCTMVAQKLKAKAVLPPPPKFDPKVVY
jgi:hypothetical protein